MHKQSLAEKSDWNEREKVGAIDKRLASERAVQRNFLKRSEQNMDSEAAIGKLRGVGGR